MNKKNKSDAIDSNRSLLHKDTNQLKYATGILVLQIYYP